MTGVWSFWDDSKPYGEHILAEGSESDVKAAARLAMEEGKVAVGDAVVEDPSGDQFGWNDNVYPPRWEEI